ncbi:cell division cycle protein cdt2 [Ephemerocybe angulata]|uniref:Cell division cycle protein cdt2 n=1 Tax=Ephemerocybe angulata TaxID=980116 RepID=A0A8H6ME81_9AGAR|nr:cell division cycle protein cdt2 [Tulosesus angulatus]
MLPSPSSSPAHVLEHITNVPPRKPLRQAPLKFFPTPPNEKKPKRQAQLLASDSPRKRIKLSQEYIASESDEYGSSSDEYLEEDSEDEDVFFAGPSARPAQPTHRANHRVTSMYNRPASFLVPSFGQLSTRPLLQSFVSSSKADVFKCESIQPDRYLTPPYACSYSHGAKQGQKSHLAVANEEGTVHIFDTSKRRDWDPEPQRSTLQPHQNGVFEVKWDETDSRIATCSGDKSARITDVKTGTITHALQGHSSTIKCVTWDPNHQKLLATGSRDGTICLWDLRTSERHGDSELHLAQPVRMIHGAHQEPQLKGKGRARKGLSAPPGITSLLYPDALTYGLVSSGSADGILKYWDLRCLESTKKSRGAKPKPPPVLLSSPIDPTTLQGSRRARGILSLAAGSGPTAGLIFGLGADSNIHCYSLPSLEPQTSRQYSHPNLKASSFYVTLSVSTCGRWLASGGTSTDGRAFLFDVEASRSSGNSPSPTAVQLSSQRGEIGAVDWAQDALATCADDGTVRIWRPDVEVYRGCVEMPEKKRWDWAWGS